MMEIIINLPNFIIHWGVLIEAMFWVFVFTTFALGLFGLICVLWADGVWEAEKYRRPTMSERMKGIPFPIVFSIAFFIIEFIVGILYSLISFCIRTGVIELI